MPWVQGSYIFYMVKLIKCLESPVSRASEMAIFICSSSSNGSIFSPVALHFLPALGLSFIFYLNSWECVCNLPLSIVISKLYIMIV